MGLGYTGRKFHFMLHDSFPSEQNRRRAIEPFWNSTTVAKSVCVPWISVAINRYHISQSVKKSISWLAWYSYYLDHPGLFLAQLKAMLRASEHNDNLAIMLPMISSVSEVQAARRLLDQGLAGSL